MAGWLVTYTSLLFREEIFVRRGDDHAGAERAKVEEHQPPAPRRTWEKYSGAPFFPPSPEQPLTLFFLDTHVAGDFLPN